MEHSAFEDIFVQHHEGLFRLMYRLVGVQEEAEDLVQDTFLRLYHHHDGIQPDKIKPWLYQVAMNLGRNVLRQRKSIASGQEALARVPLRATKGDLAESAQVRATLEQMPERQSALLLFYTAGLSREEIAAALEISPTSIGKLLERAKESFQTIYGQLS